jgi:hypothetical protein
MALRSRRGMFELPQGDSVTTTDPMTPSVSTEPTITRNLFSEFLPQSTPAPSGTGGVGVNINLNLPGLTAEASEQIIETYYDQYGDRLFPYVYTARNDDLKTGQSRGPLDGMSMEMLTAKELAARFAKDEYAQKAFGSFDNYIGYLGDILDLAEKNPEIAWWETKGFRNLTGSNQQAADFYNLEDEDARMGSGALIDAESENAAAALKSFNAMLASPEFRKIVADRGIETQFVLSDNDVYVFNGLTATEIHEGADTFGAVFESAMDLANKLALTFMTGQTTAVGFDALQQAANLGQLGPYSSSFKTAFDLMNSAETGSGIEALNILRGIQGAVNDFGEEVPIVNQLAQPVENQEPSQSASLTAPAPSSRLNNWWQGIVNSATARARRGGISGPITLPGSAGVIIDMETITNPDLWRVFLPGVIPGLPSSPTILGTVEEILSNPQIVLGGLIDDVATVFTNPEQVIGEILTDAAGENGLITTALMTDIISSVIDRIEDATGEIYRNEDGIPEVNEQGSILGGQEEESTDESTEEDILGDTTSEDDPFTDTGSIDPLTDELVVSTPEVGTTTPEVGGTTPEIGTTDASSAGASTIIDISTGEPQIGEQPQQQLGGAEDVSEGGGGSGVQSGSSMFNPFLRRLRPIQIPQISSVSQAPQKDALAELDDFINRQNGMFTGGNQII